MKILAIAFLLVIVSIVIDTPPAGAGGPVSIDGRFFGPAFASAIDLNGDGFRARTFDFRALGSVFTSVEGVADTSPIFPPSGACPPATLELEPRGHVSFRAIGGDVLFATIDPTPHLCFDPANPDETLHFTVVGGRGVFQGRTGSGEARLQDVVREQATSGEPLYIDGKGTFSLVLQ